MKDTIVELRAAIKDLPVEEIREKLGSLKKSELMRSIIMNEKEFCICRYERSQRNFWYAVVKPTLDKLGLLTAEDDTEEALTGWDKVLSKYLTELVKQGKLTYRDIMICDESRNYNVPDRYSFSPYKNIVVCCEKDTIFQFIRDISELLGCSAISSKGLCAFGAMETLLRKIRDNSENEIKELVFLIMSDYDPTGYSIANTFKVQAEIMAKQLGMNVRVIAKRIGIVPDQLSEEELKNNMYSPKKKGLDSWMKETNGINGLEKGLELDALTPERIREIFADELKKYIDDDSYVENCKNNYLWSAIRSETDKYVDGIISKIYWDLRDKVTAIPPDMMQLVKDGETHIPLDSICSINADIETCVKNYFE